MTEEIHFREEGGGIRADSVKRIHAHSSMVHVTYTDVSHTTRVIVCW